MPGVAKTIVVTVLVHDHGLVVDALRAVESWLGHVLEGPCEARVLIKWPELASVSVRVSRPPVLLGASLQLSASTAAGFSVPVVLVDGESVSGWAWVRQVIHEAPNEEVRARVELIEVEIALWVRSWILRVRLHPAVGSLRSAVYVVFAFAVIRTKLFVVYSNLVDTFGLIADFALISAARRLRPVLGEFGEIRFDLPDFFFSGEGNGGCQGQKDKVFHLNFINYKKSQAGRGHSFLIPSLLS